MRRKRQIFLSWIMVMLMVFSILPMNIVYAEDTGTDKSSVLTNITAVISQNETEIAEGGMISGTEPVSADISFAIPLSGEGASPEDTVQKGDTAAFHVANGFNLAGDVNTGLTTAEGVTIGHVSLTQRGDAVTANVIFDGEDAVFTQGSVTGKFHLDLNAGGEQHVSILNSTYTVSTSDAAVSRAEAEPQDFVGQDVTHLIAPDLIATVKQEGNEIQPGDVLLDSKPVQISISFNAPVQGDGGEEGTYINKGDFALISLSDALKLPVSSEPIELKTEAGILVGHVTFVSGEDGKVTARVDFNGADEVFDGTNEAVSAAFNATFDIKEEGGEAGSGDKTILILKNEYKLEKPPVEIQYALTKSGEANLSDQTVEWTVKVSGQQGETAIDLGGYELRDNLTNVGEYVTGSFIVNDASVADPTVNDGKLSYTFPDNSTGEQIVRFKTKIPDEKYFASGKQTIGNKAELYKEDNFVIEKTGSVEFTPSWIKKEGKANADQGSSGVYNPNNRTITWTITANDMEATLKNPFLKDVLPKGLTLDTATVQYWNGTAWGSAQNITPDENSNYAIGNKTDGSDRILDTKVLLTITTKVPDEDYTTSVTTYKNKASIYWDGQDGIGTGEIGVGIGYNAIAKDGKISDKDNQTIQWTVKVNAKGQDIPGMKVYDLLIYGKKGSVSLGDLSVTGIDDEVKNSLDPQYNQRYKDGSFAGDGLSLEVLPVMKGGERAGDLLVVTGLVTEAENTFTFESIVTNPDIFAGNGSSNVRNTASLFSANKKLNTASKDVSYPSNMLKKELIKRGHTGDPAAGVNDILTEGDDGFDYQDKSAIFRMSVNADGLNLTNATGKALGKVTVTDTLPAGWELADIADGQDYLIFEGVKNTSGQSVTAADTKPDTVEGLTYDKTANSITFTFATLDKPYVILVKAKPTTETLEKYFGQNGTNTVTNSVKMTADNWDTGIESKRNVEVKSSLLSKSAKLAEEGVVRWTVDYKPYEVGNSHTKIADTLPTGLDLRTDADGNLILGGNITITELTLNADGSYAEGSKITPVIGTNVFYDSTDRVLTFTFPDSEKAYRFTYLTDVTGEPGKVTNEVKLYGESEEQESTDNSYVITEKDGSATMRRSGWVEITKIDGTTKESIPDVEFTIYALDGTTIIRKGKTGADGTLKLRGLPEGNYILKETGALDGYTPDEREHSLSVKRVDNSTVICSIDGKTGDDANLIAVKNYQEGTAGELTISKVVAGEHADKTKFFDFTITLKDADGNAVDGTYPCTSSGVSAGEIEIKEGAGTISLADGQSITISGIPKDTKYTVEEADYSREGYVSGHTGGSGTIVADTEQKAAFTNTHEPASLVLEAKKVLTGKDLTEGAFSFELKDEEGNTVQTKTNDADGKIVFDKISYDSVGEHQYTIQEVSGDEAGVTYDTNVISVTVSVEVGGDGKLNAVPVYTDGNQTFTNGYKPAEGSVVLQAQKVLEGMNLGAGDFSFELKDQDGQILQTKENDAQGMIYFDPIEYTEAGTYQYTIQEVSGDLAGVTYDKHVINVTVTVEDEDAQLVAVPAYEGDQTFTNIYKPAAGSVVLQAQKVLEGKELNAGDFNFELKDEDGKVLQTKKNDAQGMIYFDPIEYTEAGTYQYTIQEILGEQAGVTYDTHVINVTITAEDKNAQLVTDVVYEGEQTFTNTYKPADGSVVLQAQKVLKGKKLTAGAFSFELKDKDGKTVQTKKNDAQGAIYFDEIQYDNAGTYEYTIQEVIGDQARTTYDKHVLQVTVTVEDQDGKLTAKAAYTGDQTFTNIYKSETGKSDSPKKTNTGKRGTAKTKTPKTGDTSTPIMYVVILLISAGALLTVVGIKKRKDLKR